VILEFYVELGESLGRGGIGSRKTCWNGLDALGRAVHAGQHKAGGTKRYSHPHACVSLVPTLVREGSTLVEACKWGRKQPRGGT
jgi:hypothetical protein